MGEYERMSDRTMRSTWMLLRLRTVGGLRWGCSKTGLKCERGPTACAVRERGEG